MRKRGETGPTTPSAPEDSIASTRRINQSGAGCSSSSMKATSSPIAFSTASFLASAMFCRGSTQ